MVPQVKIPEAFEFLLHPARYKVAYGGRNAAKSWSFASVLLAKAAVEPLRILCTREFQASILESVYRVLKDQITALGLQSFFEVQKNIIRGKVGSEFIFKGLRMNIGEIKSTEGVDLCWVEEAQMASDESWSVLIPTIRKPNSEIWISFNTGQAEDPTYKRFVASPPPDSIVRKINYDLNPFHSEVMEKEREYLLRVDPEAHDHIWLGNPLQISDACIFRNKFEVDSFDTPENIQLLFGADFGYSNDPATLIRFFIRDNKLFVDYESYGVGVELDELPEFYDAIPESRKWNIKADNARPESISYIKKKVLRLNQQRNGQGVSRMVFHSCGNSRKLLFTKGASTPSKSLSFTHGKETGYQEKFCRSSLTPITTVSTQSATG